jgi:hypothetical protein
MPKSSSWIGEDNELASDLLTAEALRRLRKPAEAIAACNNILASGLKWCHDVMAAIYFVRASSAHDLGLRSAANEDWQRVITTATDHNIVNRAVAAITRQPIIAQQNNPPQMPPTTYFLRRVLHSVTAPPLPVHELTIHADITTITRQEEAQVKGGEHELPQWMAETNKTLSRNRLAYERDLKAYSAGLRGDNMPPFDQLQDLWLVYVDERYVGAHKDRMEAVKLTNKDCYSVFYDPKIIK